MAETYVVYLLWAKQPAGRVVFEFEDKDQMMGHVREVLFEPDPQVRDAIAKYLESGYATLAGGLGTNNPGSYLDGVDNALWRLQETYPKLEHERHEPWPAPPGFYEVVR